jgi:iron complex outermembrane receptor protein
LAPTANESDIFVRGFGRGQVPLTLDGVRIYLPADNRLDFSRFLTADIAAVQVQKGYASVLDGPGGMGGAINLVTRRPAKPFEVTVVGLATAAPEFLFQDQNRSLKK